MGMQQVKRYRFTCDQDVKDREDFAVSCDAQVVVEAPDKWAALRELPEGWRAAGRPTDTVHISCPREDHW